MLASLSFPLTVSLALTFVVVLQSLHHAWAAVSFSSTGMTVVLNDVPYYIPPTAVTTLSLASSQLHSATSVAGLVPVTLVTTPSLNFSQSDLEATLSTFASTDDVWSTGFLQGKLDISTSMYQKLLQQFLSIVLQACFSYFHSEGSTHTQYISSY